MIFRNIDIISMINPCFIQMGSLDVQYGCTDSGWYTSGDDPWMP